MRIPRAIIVVLVVLVLASLACARSVPGAVEKATEVPAAEGAPGDGTVMPTDVLSAVYAFATQTAMAGAGQPPAQETPGAPVVDPGQAPELPVVPTQPAVIMPQPTQQPAAVLPAPTQGPAPASYKLQKNEHPYCIARRFNVSPAELLSLNGLGSYSIVSTGTNLRIPQTGQPFPGQRALKAHPATYSVSGGETIYSIACLFGDVEPMAIAAVNGLQAPYHLSPGQILQIP